MFVGMVTARLVLPHHAPMWMKVAVSLPIVASLLLAFHFLPKHKPTPDKLDA